MAASSGLSSLQKRYEVALRYEKEIIDGNMSWNNLYSILKELSLLCPENPALLWLEGEAATEVERVSSGALLQRIRNLAYHLTSPPSPATASSSCRDPRPSERLQEEAGLKAGDVVILCYPPGVEFYVAFWACLSKGIIPAPLTPIDPANIHGGLTAKLEAVIEDSGAVSILTESQYLFAVRTALACSPRPLESPLSQQATELGRASIPWLATDLYRPTASCSISTEDELVFDGGSADTLAFLQYTSGSTGAPKGVEVTHAALSSNLLHTTRMTEGSSSWKVYKGMLAVSWLPHFHDMGLVGFHIGPLVAGVPIACFSPLDFLRCPASWLRAIARYTRSPSERFQRVITGAPSDALEMCVAKITDQEASQLDLSGLHALILGAERVRPAALTSFSLKFSTSGFSPTSYLPAYGMAENVLHVTCKQGLRSTPLVLTVPTSSLAHGHLSPLTSSLKRISAMVAGDSAFGDGEAKTATEMRVGRATQANGAGKVTLNGKVHVASQLENKRKTSTESGFAEQVREAAVQRHSSQHNLSSLGSPAHLELVSCGEVHAFRFFSEPRSGKGRTSRTEQKLTEGEREGRGEEDDEVSDLPDSMKTKTKKNGKTSKKNRKLAKRKEEELADPSTILVVVDPQTMKPLPDGQVGELWVAGRSKARGYFKKPELTRQTFRARLAGSSSLSSDVAEKYLRQEYLRTGDLGVIFGGHLFITGRLKELIILHGSNFYPQDIEEGIRQAHLPSVRPGALAAFSATAGDQEHLCIMLEVQSTKDSHRNGSSTSFTKFLSPFRSISHTISRSAPAQYLGSLLAASLKAGGAWALSALPERLTADLPVVLGAVLAATGFLPGSSCGSDADQCVAPPSQMELQKLQAVVREVRKAVLSTCGVSVGEVVVMPPHTIPKTSSGKIQRSAAGKLYLEGALHKKVLYASPSRAVKKRRQRLGLPDLPFPTALSYEPSRVAQAAVPVVPAVVRAIPPTSAARFSLEEVETVLFRLLQAELQLDDSELQELKASIEHGGGLDELGIDSINLASLVNSLTKELQITRPLSRFMFLADPSFKGVVRVLHTLANEKGEEEGKLQQKERGSTHEVRPRRASDLSPLSPEQVHRLPHILGIGTALPGPGMPQKRIIERQLQSLGLPDERAQLFKKIGENVGVGRRYSVLPNVEAIYFGKKGLGNDEGVEARNAVYKQEAPKLATLAAEKALKDWGGDKADITHVVAVTCTGVIVPGIEFQLLLSLGLEQDTERLSIQFMGCFGALSGIKTARALAAQSPDNRILLVCVELCSLHMQLDDKVDNFIGSALFSDGAGALVIGAEPQPLERGLLEIHHTASVLIPDTLHMMDWILTKSFMQIGLSKHISEEIYNHIRPFFAELLSASRQPGLSADDTELAIHPGGPAILSALCSALGLHDSAAQPSWDVLQECGNMSSATLIFVLERLSLKAQQKMGNRTQPPSGQWVPALAFGPGLNVEGALLRHSHRQPNTS